LKAELPSIRVAVETVSVVITIVTLIILIGSQIDLDRIEPDHNKVRTALLTFDVVALF